MSTRETYVYAMRNGLPIEPPICSEKCNTALMEGIGEPMSERRVGHNIPKWEE